MERDPRDQRIAELEAKVAWAMGVIERLEKRVVELEAQLAKNSTNSSKPPSSDGPGVQRPEVKPKGAKRGGQRGHEPHRRELIPTEQCRNVVEHKPERCRCGSSNLSEAKVLARHQVIDLPPLAASVDEHQSFACTCLDCGATVVEPIPPEYLCSAFSESVVALIGQLRVQYHLPVRSVVRLLRELFHLSISPGAIADQEQTLARAIAKPVAEAHEAAKKAVQGNADETGWRENKRRAWLWVLVTDLATIFMVHKSRGGEAAQALLGERFGGLTTDRWVGYSPIKAQWRQLCWAHLIRDFLGWLEYGGDARPIAEAMLKACRKMFRWWNQLKDGDLSRARFRARMAPVRRELLDLLECAAVCPQLKVTGMAEHMLTHRAALFSFVDHEGVEPTNNAAERAIRHAAIWRKICFGTDSEKGSRFVERMLTVVATLKQQGREVRSYLADAVHALRFGFSAPKLLPA